MHFEAVDERAVQRVQEMAIVRAVMKPQLTAECSVSADQLPLLTSRICRAFPGSFARNSAAQCRKTQDHLLPRCTFLFTYIAASAALRIVSLVSPSSG